MNTNLKGLGFRRDLPDIRDQVFHAKKAFKKKLFPSKLDFRNHPDMPPIYDQGELGCHDKETEVLTDQGWIKWSEYKGELLATINPLFNKLEYQKPLKLIKKFYKGILYKVAKRNQDFAVTPDHRMYQRRWVYKNKKLSNLYEFTPIKNCGWYYGLLTAPNGNSNNSIKKIKIGNKTYSGTNFFKLIALILSDGWIGGTESNKNTVSFCCFNSKRQNMVRKLARELGIKETTSRKGVWKFYDPYLHDWLKNNCYVSLTLTSPNKKIPSLIRKGSTEQIKDFLHFFGDQSTSCNNRMFFSSSTFIIDGLQELLLLVGKRSTICKRDPRVSKIKNRTVTSKHIEYCLIEKNTKNLSIETKNNTRTEYYEGMVYCAEVKNSILITRRKGHILISGNSCTAQSVGALCDFEYGKDFEYEPSKLFLYYVTRSLEGTVDVDAGATIRNTIKAANEFGVCVESKWPYIIENYRVTPSQEIFDFAAAHQVLKYRRVRQTLDDLKECLLEENLISFGISVYEGLYKIEGSNCILEMPTYNQSLLGGHALCLVGYDQHKEYFIVRNSWGIEWGVEGYFYIPYSYILNPEFSMDFWTISLVEK